MRGPGSHAVSTATLALAGALAGALAAGCADAPAREPVAPASAAALARGHGHGDGAHGAEAPGPDVREALARLRSSTARFHSLDAAIAAGWDARVTGCMSGPAGGMGVHWADLGRFDATLDALRPEILVYAPGPRGQARLVAVEWAVPLAAWTRPEPPELFGVPFHVNEAFGLWVLHAWVWEPNPSGVFADWNPRVACPAS